MTAVLDSFAALERGASAAASRVGDMAAVSDLFSVSDGGTGGEGACENEDEDEDGDGDFM